jgi:prepilin-type N-terminal cleavage/methylation domain-containing protein
MRGFTLTELIVVVAIMALAATLGTRYYFTNVEMYRFQNALSEFKSSVNLARSRSMTGVVAAKPLAININTIEIDGSNIIKLNPTLNQDLTVVTNGTYVTLLGFCPNDSSQKELLAKTPPVTFPYWINGPLWKVTSSNGSSPVAVDVILKVPAFGKSIAFNATTPATAYMHLKSAMRIMQYTSGEESKAQTYAGAYESGPSIDYKYKSNVEVGFAIKTDESKPCGPGLPEIGKDEIKEIVFDKGLTAWGKAYCVTFRLKSGTTASTVSYTILPTGVLTQP